MPPAKNAAQLSTSALVKSGEEDDALLASEERYRFFLESLPVMVWSLDAGGLATFVNKAFADYTGLSAEDYNALGHKAFLHPDDLAPVLKARSDAIVSGKDPVPMENRYRGRDGEYRWFLSGIRAIRGDSDQVVKWIGTAVDIHERKLTEEALADSEERLRFYLEATRDGVWDWDMVTERRNWSDRNYELVGLKPGEVAPSVEAFLDRCHPDDRELVKAGIKDFMETGDHSRFQYRAMDATGGYRWIQTECKVFRDPAGKPVRMVGANTDIHDQKVAEDQIKALNETLEERVSERTRELEATTGELQDFCHSVSHDLRGPLRSINGFSKALEEDYGDLLDETGKEHLARIRNATLKLADLIDGLLSMARITRAEMARRKVDLTAIAESILDDLRAADPGRSVKAVVAPNLATYGDASLVQIALTNLIENAWKFTSKRENAQIEVGSEGKGVFFVRDNGVGFEMAYLGNMFAPFQRLHTRDEFPGDGIGLAIVSRVIQRHGGSITAEGKVGEGAKFTFTLPSRSGDQTPARTDRTDGS